MNNHDENLEFFRGLHPVQKDNDDDVQPEVSNVQHIKDLLLVSKELQAGC